MAAAEVRQLRAPGLRAVPVVESINPDKAKEYLATMGKNRPVSGSRVVEFGIEMEKGSWVLNGETIKFDKNGKLIDGQHRLEACILAKKPFLTYVVRGIEDERAFATIDVGKTRTHGDIFALSGFKDQNNAAATATILYYVKKGLLQQLPGPNAVSTGVTRKMTQGTPYSIIGGRKTISKDELLAFVENGNLREKIVEGVRMADDSRITKLMPKSQAAAAFVLFAEKNVVDAHLFMKHVAEGEGLKKTDPAYVLREKLRDLRDTKHTRVNRWAVMLLLFKAWNAFRNKEDMKQLKLMENEKFPKLK